MNVTIDQFMILADWIFDARLYYGTGSDLSWYMSSSQQIQLIITHPVNQWSPRWSGIVDALRPLSGTSKLSPALQTVDVCRILVPTLHASSQILKYSFITWRSATLHAAPWDAITDQVNLIWHPVEFYIKLRHDMEPHPVLSWLTNQPKQLSTS